MRVCLSWRERRSVRRQQARAGWCVPVLVAPGAGPAERAWAAGSQPKVFSSLCYPVLIEPTLGTAIYRSRSQVWGRTYQPELWRVAGLIADGLGAARVQGDGPTGTSKPVLARVLGVLAAVLLIVTAALAGTGHVGRALVPLLLAAMCTLQAVGFAASRPRGSAVPLRFPVLRSRLQVIDGPSIVSTGCQATRAEANSQQ